MASQPGERGGKQISVWLRSDLLEKLERMKVARGVKRNKVLNQLVDEAPEP
jgi:hypothetical protein